MLMTKFSICLSFISKGKGWISIKRIARKEQLNLDALGLDRVSSKRLRLEHIIDGESTRDNC